MSSFSPQGMLNWAAAMCNMADVGYSQTYRNYQTVNGITYFDCSSFVFFALWLGGGMDVASSVLPSWLRKSTNLQDYKDGNANAWTVTPITQALNYFGWSQVNVDPQYWLPGDILVKTSTHVEICYSAPSPLEEAGAHGTGQGTLPLADQVSIRPTYSGYYDQVWRDSSQPTPVPPGPGHRTHGPMPAWLLKQALEIKQGGNTQ